MKNYDSLLKQVKEEKRYISKLNRFPFDEKENINNLKKFISFFDNENSFTDKNEEDFITTVIGYAIYSRLLFTYFFKIIRVVNHHFSDFYDYMLSDNTLNDSFKSSWKEVYDGLKLMEEEKALILLSKAPVSIADYDILKTSFINNNPDVFIECLNKSANTDYYNYVVNFYIYIQSFARFVIDYSRRCCMDNKEIEFTPIFLTSWNHFKTPDSLNPISEGLIVGVERFMYVDDLIERSRLISSVEEMSSLIKEELAGGRYEWLIEKQAYVIYAWAIIFSLFKDYTHNLSSIEQDAIYDFIEKEELFIPMIKSLEEVLDDGSWDVPTDIFKQPPFINSNEYIGNINDKYKDSRKIKTLVEKFVAEGWLPNRSVVKQWTFFYLTGRARPEDNLSSDVIWKGKLENLLYTCLFLYRPDGGSVKQHTYERAITLFGIKTSITQYSPYAQRSDSDFKEFLNNLFEQ